MRFSILINGIKRINNSVRLRRDQSVIERDSLKLFIRAGTGGNGIMRYNGIGGNGGSIFVRASDKLDFDKFYNRHKPDDEKWVELKAESGESSRQTKLVGRNGKDLIFDVPLGVEIVGRNQILLARCENNRERYLLARGGAGACAANNYKAEKGESHTITVHLKLRPNIGLIGYPNAGKSTLLKALVPEKDIRIADYAFTTTKPQLCYLKYNKMINRQTEMTTEKLIPMGLKTKDVGKEPFRVTLSIADLPGIVEGASLDRFNGLAALKHLEYSEIILMVVDLHGFRLSPNEPVKSPLETVALLNREMEAHDRKMVRKPVVLLLNKLDEENGEKIAKELCKFFVTKGLDDRWAKEIREEIRPRYPIHFKSVHAISAKQAKLGNLREMLGKLYERLHSIEKLAFEEDEDSDNEDRKILN